MERYSGLNPNMRILPQFALLFIFIISCIYGWIFVKQNPFVCYSQEEFYGIQNANLKDFSCSNDGEITAISSDPWIAVELETEYPLIAIEIDAMDVQDMGGEIQIFDTDTWKVKSGILRNGNNFFYFSNLGDTETVRNLRFDLFEVNGARCNIESVTINPPQYVWLIGFVRMAIPAFCIVLIFFLFKKFLKLTRSSLEYQEIKQIVIWLIETVLAILVAFFISDDLRLPCNATVVGLVAICLFAVFKVDCMELSLKHRVLIVFFAVGLSLANSLGQHINIGTNPYSDCMDVSFVSQYDLYDYLSVVFLSIVIYRCCLCLPSVIGKLINKSLSKRRMTCKHISFWFYMIVLLISWTPYFVLYYPGFILSDSITSIEQALGVWPMSNHFPVLYTMFIKVCISLGLMYGDLKFGCAIYTVLQMLFVSYSLSRLIEWLSDHNVPVVICVVTTGWFSFTPFFGQISVAMWKDAIFGSAMVLLTLTLLNIIYDTKENIQPVYIRDLIITELILCFSRNNGIYVLIFVSLVISLVRISKSISLFRFREMLTSTLVVFLVYLIITGPIYDYLRVKPTEKVESLGICLNQMAAVAASTDSNMSEKDKEFMDNLLPLERYSKSYRPCVVDLLKWDPKFNNEFLEHNTAGFLKTYFSLGIKNPVKYIKAWSLVTFGYWAPNRWELFNDRNNLNRGVFRDLPTDTEAYRSIEYPQSAIYKFFPTEGSIIPLGIISWFIFFLVILILINGNFKDLIVIAPSIGVIITLIIASPFWYWPRYGIGQLYLLPFYLFFIIKYLRT